MYEYKYFTEKEVSCSCCGKDKMEPDTMKKLDELREFCGFPFVVTSAYRCPRHNEAIGGAEFSQHVSGKAIDLAIDGARAIQLIENASRFGFRGLGISQKGSKRFIHIDTRDNVGFWSY